jgi:hypothetical protein
MVNDLKAKLLAKPKIGLITVDSISVSLTIELLQNRSERLPVASSLHCETGIYLGVNEDFEYRIGVNRSRAAGSAKTLMRI